MNSTSPLYVRDIVCTNDIIAASKEGCVSAFSSYSENWLNLVFTAAFGVVGKLDSSLGGKAPSH